VFGKYDTNKGQCTCSLLYIDISLATTVNILTKTSDICNFARYCHNNYDNFHILGIQPVYGYMENKVNE